MLSFTHQPLAAFTTIPCLCKNETDQTVTFTRIKQNTLK